MSASLVGSEMCIRDSSRHGATAGPPGADSCATTAGSGSSSRRRAGSRPVSYTQLTLPTICSV
eukprot:12478193-Alexandrium_andersonii.AAC.1